MRELNVGALLEIAQGCPSMEFLFIFDSDDFDFGGISEVVNIMPNLQRLTLLPGSPSDKFLNCRTIQSHSLRAVEIGWFEISVAEFWLFSQGCPNITTLLLRVTFKKGGAFESTLKYCPNVTYLQLDGKDSNQTDEVLEGAAMYCPLLRTLNITYPTYRLQQPPREVSEQFLRNRRYAKG